jgi:DNA-binding beta-propeller fold protein YncE
MSNNKDFKVKNGIQPTVYHEAVGTVVSGSEGFSIAGASYDSKSFSVVSQSSNPLGLSFNDNGTKVYVIGPTNDTVYQYSLSTAFDISTSSYDSVSFSVASQLEAPAGVAFNNDGTKMYVVGYVTDSVFQYSLSTAFNVGTASYDSVSFSVASQQSSPRHVIFNNNGTKMYITGQANTNVHQYSLSTAFDVSTASYDSISFDLSSQDTTPWDIAFNTDGTKMYMVGTNGDNVHQYSLSTAFNVGTASYESISFDLSSQDVTPVAIDFSNDGTKMYVLGSANVTIYQYSTALNTAELDLSSGSVFDYTPTSDVQVTLTNPAASGTSSGATLLLGNSLLNAWDTSTIVRLNTFSVSGQDIEMEGIFLKPDGTAIYGVGYAGDTVEEYTMSTAYDLSTASYTRSFSVAGQETTPSDLFFKSDGTKMYVIGFTGDDINEYALSTAWDITTASFTDVFSVSGQDSLPKGMFIKPDGTKLYVLGDANDSVYQYSMSTAWDVSTSSYDSVSFSVASQDASPGGLFFKSDGTKMYVIGTGSDKVHEYDLSTAWNVSTATLLQSTSLEGTDEAAPNGVGFSPDGDRMYVVGSSGDAFYEYSVGTPATITYPTSLQWSGGTAPTSPAIGETDVLTFNTTDGGTTYQAVQAIDGAK